MIKKFWACSILFALSTYQGSVRGAETPPKRAFDVVVYGSSTPAIVAAVRCARDGLDVALVSPTQGLAGSDAALGAFEAHYYGRRAPILQELIDGVTAHYREHFGSESEQFRECTGGSMIKFEPHVFTKIVNFILSNESRIQVFRGYVAEHAELDGRLIQAVSFRSRDGEPKLRLEGRAFVEAGYEGDLMALAGATFRVGREGRDEFKELTAGRVFTQWITGRYPRAAVEGRLNLIPYGATTSAPLAGSTGEGDDNIQSYSVRICLTNDSSNRRDLSAPPNGYDRERYAPILLSPAEKEKLRLPFHHRFLIYSLREMVELDHIFHGQTLPNKKRSWNATNLTGAGKQYPTSNWAQRDDIKRQHFEFALGLLYFLQNDSVVPEDLRARAREWGLARDEFTTTDNLPPDLYVRESRRLVGRAVFTEHDALIAPGLERAPLHCDSICMTDGSLDSLACTTERLAGSLCDGQLFQMEISRPGQVPYGALLPQNVDNLLVVTAVSATHVGWGAIRLAPTLIHLAESAAMAIVLAARENIPPAELEVHRLQQHLVEHGMLIAFFNDIDMHESHPYAASIEYLAGLGFFFDYNARPQAPLTRAIAAEWAGTLARVVQGNSDPMVEAKNLRSIEEGNDRISLAEYRSLLAQQLSDNDSGLKVLDETIRDLDAPIDEPLERAIACELMYKFIRSMGARAMAVAR